MKSKFSLYKILCIMGIICMLGITNAATLNHNPDAGISYTLNGNENFTAGTITITDGTKAITILDRNLGATEIGGGTGASRGSYGYYFQRGNNYGFSSDSNATITTTTTQVDVSAYGPENPYSSDIFIETLGDWSSVQNDNLWGGGGDNETNGYGSTSDSPITGRQGPCPEGYHIPSLGDRNELIVLWYNNKYNANLVIGDYNYIIEEDTPISIDLSEDLLIPFAGFREADTTDILAVGSWVYTWTSSPDDIYGINLNLQRGSRGNPRKPYYMIVYDVDYRAYGLTIRCFKDEADVVNTEYSIEYVLDGGTNNNENPENYTQDSETITLKNATKKGFKFAGWYLDSSFTTKITTIPQGSTGDKILYAKWKKKSNNNGSVISSGNTTNIDNNTGTNTEINTDTGNNTHGNITGNTSQNDSGNISLSELEQAFEFSKKYGITTMNTIQEANMDKPLTRIAMAKMLSYYAINVMSLKPDENRINKFKDIPTELDAEYGNGVTLAYQLGIMGINMPNNEFRPFDLVTRSEFGTALSRMLYKTSDGQYEKTDKFYTLHFDKLKLEGIMTMLDPNMKELRGYVMIMLMRSAEK